MTANRQRERRAPTTRTRFSPASRSIGLEVTDDKGATTPTADFVHSDEPQVHTPVTLDGSRSFDPEGAIVTYEWDFGFDGSYEAQGATVTETWDESGDQKVSLRVTDEDGGQKVINGTVFVSGDGTGHACSPPGRSSESARRVAWTSGQAGFVAVTIRL